MKDITLMTDTTLTNDSIANVALEYDLDSLYSMRTTVLSCGHEGGLPYNADSATRKCLACWKDAESASNDEFAKEHDLSKLHGTDNRVRWASSIRRAMMIDIMDRLRAAQEMGCKDIISRHNKTLVALRRIASAFVWIAARDYTPEFFVEDFMKTKKRDDARNRRARR